MVLTWGNDIYMLKNISHFERFSVTKQLSEVPISSRLIRGICSL